MILPDYDIYLINSSFDPIHLGTQGLEPGVVHLTRAPGLRSAAGGSGRTAHLRAAGLWEEQDDNNAETLANLGTSWNMGCCFSEKESDPFSRSEK